MIIIVYLFFFFCVCADAEDEDDAGEEGTLTTTWYLAAFGGLVLFFFVVTCSEMFFGSPIYPRPPVELPQSGFLRRRVYGVRNPGMNPFSPESPPPPYHLFAPPSYDTVKVTDLQHEVFHEHTGKKLADVYVVPVHAPNACKHQVAESAAAVAAVDAKLLAVLSPPPLSKHKSQPKPQPPQPKLQPHSKSDDK